MDAPEEPLNLTIKKMPIAIVAPFSVVDPKSNNNNNHNTNNNNNNNESHVSDLNKCDEDLPEDLSLKNKTASDQGLDLTKRSNFEKSNLNRNHQLRSYFCKNEETRSLYDRNTFNDNYNDNKLVYENTTSETERDTFYSFLNSLDNKFLSMWYMNTILSQQNPYLNLTSATYRTKPDTSPGSNKILNNLLDKKPYASYKFPMDFDALIKNEMQPENNEAKGWF